MLTCAALTIRVDVDSTSTGAGPGRPRADPAGHGPPILALGPAKQGQGHTTSGPALGPQVVGPAQP